MKLRESECCARRRREIVASATASAQSRRHAINVISIRIRVLPYASNLLPSSIVTLAFIMEDSFPPARAKQTARRSVREAHSQPRFFLRALLLTPALFHARSMCICAFRARKREVYYRACPAISILSRHFCFVLLLSESARRRDKEPHS